MTTRFTTRQGDTTHARPSIPVVLFAAALLVASALPAHAAGSPERQAAITVIGEGELTVEPDQATVTVGVQLYDQDAGAAAVALAERMSAVIEAIRNLGIPTDQIQTTNYSIFFERDFQAPRGPSTGEPPAGSYRVENMVRVTISDPDRAASVVEAAIGAGANQMFGIQFSLGDPGGLDARARSLAMADALRRARELAGEAGRTVGSVITISEVVGGGPAPYESRAMIAGAGGGGPIEAGGLTYRARVQVTYALE